MRILYKGIIAGAAGHFYLSGYLALPDNLNVICPELE